MACTVRSRFSDVRRAKLPPSTMHEWPTECPVAFVLCVRLRMRKMDDVESVGGKSASLDARAMKSVPSRQRVGLSVAAAMIGVPAPGATALP
jgi:hypothetical protein